MSGRTCSPSSCWCWCCCSGRAACSARASGGPGHDKRRIASAFPSCRSSSRSVARWDRLPWWGKSLVFIAMPGARVVVPDHPRPLLAERAVLPGRRVHPARPRASTSSWASPACSTSATWPSSPSAPTPPPSSRPTAARSRRGRPCSLAIVVAMVGGRDPRRAHPAPAGRLPRHRHARLRRDRADLGPEQPRASARRAASPASPTRRAIGGTEFGTEAAALLLPRRWSRSSSSSCSWPGCKRSRVGRSWAAIREDEDAAELMGVPTFKMKLWSFAMGAVDRRARRAGSTPPRSRFINPDHVPVHLVDPDPRRRGARRPRARPRASSPAPSRSASSPSTCATPAATATARLPEQRHRRQRQRHHRVPRLPLRPRPRADDDLPAPGPAPEPPAGRRAGRVHQHRGGRWAPRSPRRTTSIGDVDAGPVHASRCPPTSSCPRTPSTRAAEVAARRCSSSTTCTMEFGGVVALERRVDRGPQGPDLRDHRPERRRQDDAVQLRHRRLPAHRRARSSSTAESIVGQQPHQHHRGGRGPHVPEHPAVPEHDRRREHHGRRRRPPRAPASPARCSAAPATSGRSGVGQAEAAAPARVRRHRRTGPSDLPATCPTATSGGSRSPGPSPPSRRCCSSTSRPPASTRRRSRRSSASSARSATAASPWSSSSTTWAW